MLLEVTAPRIPCAKLGRAFGDRLMVKRFAQALRPGALRIVEEGDVGAGDPIDVVAASDHDITVAFVADAILHDDTLIPRVLDAPQLAARVLHWARDQAA